MRTSLCTLIFLFSLPRSLNGHLATSHKNTNVTNKVENASEARNYTIDSETKNVVSFSSSVQTQHLTSHSEEQGTRLKLPNGEDETLRTKRNVHYDNLTMSTHNEMQTQDEASQQKELLKPTESSHRPHTTPLLPTENATEFNVPPITPNATRIDVVSPEEKTSSGLLETQEATQETPFTSNTGLYGSQANNTHTNTVLQTIHPPVKSTDQPSPMTNAHTSTIATVTDFKGTVNTNVLKTTERTKVTDKWTSTQAPELETSSTTKPKTMTTTKKTTTKKSTTPSNDKQKGNPGPAVAAVIGTTFFLMFIAIIFILVRKRKMQRKQLENPEWAGPSPFLDGEPNLPNTDEPETVTRQGFSQMSVSRYLSQRLSKHLTFGRNTNEEVLMGDILQGSTFGHQNPDEVQAPNGNPTAAQDSTEGQASVDSSDTKTPAPENAQEPVMESKESKETDDVTPPMSSGPNTAIKLPPPLVSIDLDSLSEEAAPLQTSDGGIVPPAPPLP
ncbi:hypothetical protein M9458_030586 [Cirrhinus mrigala]|uniref:Protein EVI2B n=1 Tax=Cirrhinus mrigala TaxID=683832 RepID=A0ABD0PMU5_CIRMR